MIYRDTFEVEGSENGHAVHSGVVPVRVNLETDGQFVRVTSPLRPDFAPLLTPNGWHQLAESAERMVLAAREASVKAGAVSE